MHKSVLLNESIENLNLKDDYIVVDCTLGFGGHSKEILKRIKRGRLYAFDQDIEAINYNEKNIKDKNIELINTNFINLKKELEKRNIKEVDAILFDLGVSSYQLDKTERGFSYNKDYKLDMRMNQNQKLSAYEVVNEYSEENLTKILFEYSEEKYSRSISKNIVKYRNIKKIETTLELVEIIKKSVPMKYKLEKHPAKRTFQAIRIEVNNELENLEKALEDAIKVLGVNRRLCVITFHSLEDKITKKVFDKYSKEKSEFKNLPSIPEEYKPIAKVYKKIKPSIQELNDNPRSKSSTLRILEKTRKE